MPAPGVQSDLQKSGVEKCIRAGDADVAGEGHIHPRANSWTVHGCNREEFAFGNGHERPIDRVDRVGLAISGSSEIVEIGPGAECRTCTGYYDRPEVLIVI